MKKFIILLSTVFVMFLTIIFNNDNAKSYLRNFYSKINNTETYDINYINNLEKLYENLEVDYNNELKTNKILKDQNEEIIEMIFSSDDNDFKKKLINNFDFKKFPNSWKIASEFLYKTKNNELILRLINKHNLKIYNQNYQISKYKLPLPDYYSWKDKPISYLGYSHGNLFLITADGIILYSQIKFEYDKTIIFKTLSSNIREVINDVDLLNKGSVSIRDIHFNGNDIYLSYNKKIKEDCYTTALARAKLNYEKLYFQNFFVPNSFVCNGTIAQSGGKIAKIDDNSLAFSLGEYRERELAQDKDNVHGKILNINIANGDYKIISKGHRNVQGLYFDRKKNIIVSSEHGPKGGDEINIFQLENPNNNFGWPISSYGNHYDGKFRNEAPLHKNHKKYGFIEPIKYFNPSIGISDVEGLSDFFNYDGNIIGVAALGFNPNEGDKIVHLFKFSEVYDKIIDINYIETNERVRDILSVDNSNCIYLILEDSPALGIICK